MADQIAAGAGIRILVVDDEQAVRDGLATWLGRRRFSVSSAPNLKSASACAIRDRPDVILLDVRLGAEDGLQLIQILRGVGLDIPCVVLTGHAGPRDGFKARELGVACLIEKPSSPDEISDALRRAAAGEPKDSGALPAPIELQNAARSPSNFQLPNDGSSHRVREAVRYIEASFTDPALSVTDVADHIGVTPEHLARLFQNVLGKSPLTVINQLRVCRAQQLFGNPRLNLGQVANLCGYRSTRQLSGWLRLLAEEQPLVRRASLLSGNAKHQEID